jgi:hypothetical protein
MDTIFRETFQKHEYDTKHAVTFEYQKGYSDATEDFGDLEREIDTTIVVVSIVLMVLVVHFLFRMRICRLLNCRR